MVGKYVINIRASQAPLEVKNPHSHKRQVFDPWVRKILWRRKRLPTPVFLPGKPHGQRSLASYSPWGHRESDRAE